MTADNRSARGSRPRWPQRRERNTTIPPLRPPIVDQPPRSNSASGGARPPLPPPNGPYVARPRWPSPAVAAAANYRRADLPTRHTSRPLPALSAPQEDAEAARQVASAFAVDFLSWDEADPGRRGRALEQWVSGATEDQLAKAGWSGWGRQRADLALVGTTVRLSEHGNHLLVHVRVRVTPYRRLGPTTPPARDTTDILPFPAAAPAPVDRRWEALESYWYELLVPVLEVEGQWKVDLARTSVVPMPPLDLSTAGGGAQER